MDLSLTYADISISPIYLSEIDSREEVNTKTDFLGFKLKLPILSAPMRTVTGAKMAYAMKKHGGLGILSRIDYIDDKSWEVIDGSMAIADTHFVPSLPIKGPLLENVRHLYHDYKVQTICLDTANGYHVLVGNTIQLLKKEFPEIKIIAGNVGSLEGYRYLDRIGADAVRVGIGNGSVCSTSVATGIGVGQVTLLNQINRWRDIQRNADYTKRETPLVIADGGIKEPGDICKALILGADVVMLGSMLAGTTEAPGEVIDGKKQFFGEASREAKGGEGKFVEGASTLIPYKGSVEKILQEISDGLRSSMAYMNCRTLEEFRCLSNTVVQLSLNARIERTPHGIKS